MLLCLYPTPSYPYGHSTTSIPLISLSCNPSISFATRLHWVSCSLQGKFYVSNMFREGQVIGFHMGHYPQGHARTDFERWMNSSEPYSIRCAAAQGSKCLVSITTCGMQQGRRKK